MRLGEHSKCLQLRACKLWCESVINSAYFLTNYVDGRMTGRIDADTTDSDRQQPTVESVIRVSATICIYTKIRSFDNMLFSFKKFVLGT